MLTRLDELYLSHHYYLEATDECYFGGDYTAGRGYAHSATNQHIYNFKKDMHRLGMPDWRYKTEAIEQAASNLRAHLIPAYLASATFVPVPPSKIAPDPGYDDRMTRVLRLLGDHVDVRELVVQRENMAQAHAAASRPGPTELYNNYEINQDFIDPAPSQVAVVDDVLTTGAHFKAMKRIITETYPGIEVVGIFIARRVPDTE